MGRQTQSVRQIIKPIKNKQMNTQINTDFENFTFQAKREFDAPVSLVWRTYTEKEFLDQWWAPKPWKTETKYMDFRPEGKWIYDMVGTQ